MCNDGNCFVGRFTGQLTASDPLQTLFQLLSGRIPAVATVKHAKHNLNPQKTQSSQFHLLYSKSYVSVYLVSK